MKLQRTLRITVKNCMHHIFCNYRLLVLQPKLGPKKLFNHQFFSYQNVFSM